MLMVKIIFIGGITGGVILGSILIYRILAWRWNLIPIYSWLHGIYTIQVEDKLWANKLWTAAQQGKFKQLSRILYYCRPTASALQDALNVAILNEHHDCVLLLIRSKASIHILKRRLWSIHDYFTTRDRAPLDYAAATGNTEIVTSLLEAKAFVNQKCEDFGSTRPLLHAIWNNNNAVAMQLIAAKANLNTRDVDPNNNLFHDRDPFYMAVYQGNTSLVRYMIECKARVDIPNPYIQNRTPLECALKKGHLDIADMIRQTITD